MTNISKPTPKRSISIYEYYDVNIAFYFIYKPDQAHDAALLKEENTTATLAFIASELRRRKFIKSLDLPWKAKRQKLFTFQVSSYCFRALQSRFTTHCNQKSILCVNQCCASFADSGPTLAIRYDKEAKKSARPMCFSSLCFWPVCEWPCLQGLVCEPYPSKEETLT